MNLDSILDELRSYRTRMDQAIAALQGTVGVGRAAKAAGTQRRPMSAAARARIGASKKAWWTKQKRNSGAVKKPTLIHTARRKPMSPAARKKLSAQMKARWAERKKAA